MPVANVGPTKILPYLYLGSQKDALSMETVQVGQRSLSKNVGDILHKIRNFCYRSKRNIYILFNTTASYVEFLLKI